GSSRGNIRGGSGITRPAVETGSGAQGDGLAFRVCERLGFRLRLVGWGMAEIGVGRGECDNGFQFYLRECPPSWADGGSSPEYDKGTTQANFARFALNRVSQDAAAEIEKNAELDDVSVGIKPSDRAAPGEAGARRQGWKPSAWSVRKYRRPRRPAQASW